MHKVSVALAIAVSFAAVGPTFARGGMGDSGAFIRANNERCEAQRRGEYPSTFNACLPDYPYTDETAPPRGRRAKGTGGVN